jgi:hypothetical protein
MLEALEEIMQSERLSANLTPAQFKQTWRKQLEVIRKAKGE